MNWTSFILGLLAFPMLISGLFLARIALELLLMLREYRLGQLRLTEERVAQP